MKLTFRPKGSHAVSFVIFPYFMHKYSHIESRTILGIFGKGRYPYLFPRRLIKAGPTDNDKLFLISFIHKLDVL